MLPEVVVASITRVRAGAEEAGRDADELEMWWYVRGGLADDRATAIADSLGGLATSVARALGGDLDAKLVPRELWSDVELIEAAYRPADHVKIGAANSNGPLLLEHPDCWSTRSSVRSRGEGARRTGSIGSRASRHRASTGCSCPVCSAIPSAWCGGSGSRSSRRSGRSRAEQAPGSPSGRAGACRRVRTRRAARRRPSAASRRNSRVLRSASTIRCQSSGVPRGDDTGEVGMRAPVAGAAVEEYVGPACRAPVQRPCSRRRPIDGRGRRLPTEVHVRRQHRRGSIGFPSPIRRQMALRRSR
jgi:hypothetical protein